MTLRKSLVLLACAATGASGTDAAIAAIAASASALSFFVKDTIPELEAMMICLCERWIGLVVADDLKGLCQIWARFGPE
jgi:hypothetical protein